MKVLYLINHPTMYGSNKALLNFLGPLVSSNKVQALVVMASKGDICTALDGIGVPYIVIPHMFSEYPFYGGTYLRAALKFLPRLIMMFVLNHFAERNLKQVALDFGTEILHTNVGPEHIGNSVACKIGVPHVWHVREYQDLDFGMNPFPSKKSFINKLRHPNNTVIAISEGIRKHFNMMQNSQVIYDGVLDENSAAFIEKKRRYFLFVGRIDDAKGAKDLILAFIEFCKVDTSGFVLKIAGNGSPLYLQSLHKLIASAGIGEKIEFLGYVNDIKGLIENAAALIVPSRCEGFGFVTVEAMFHGCIVVGNDMGGTHEILYDNQLGLLYKGERQLVDSLISIANQDIKAFYPMLKRAQAVAVSKYSIQRCSNDIYEVYKKLTFRARGSECLS